MQQLSGLDNLMIGSEIPNIPLHMSALMIYETGGKKGTARLTASITERFQGLVDTQFPILKCRLNEVALKLDSAYWAYDENFHLNYHVSQVALPKPSNWKQLYRLFGEFHAQPLDRSRPLWEVVVVEGLDSLEGVPRGSTALFVKIHHSVVDGKSALRLITSLHSLDPDPDAPTIGDTMLGEKPIDSDYRAPSWWSKYGRAWWHSIERPIDMAGTLLKLLPTLLHSDESDSKTKYQPTPASLFNHTVDSDRVIGHVRIEFELLRKLKKKHHCTVNDIALCIVAGAMRSYLDQKSALPEENLTALMPIDIRRKDEDGNLGNHVGVAKVALYTSICDTKKRLLAISAESSKSKKSSKKKTSHALLHLVDDLHPAIILWLGQWLVSSGMLETLPQMVNTVVSNVPGLSDEAYLAGSRLVDYLGFGPLAPNMGLFHTVSSTQDHVNITFLSTATFVGDGGEYLDCLQQSLAEVAAL